jgi:glucosamine--fructose-6-phosphate aminotransferase (isomerizing)
MVSFPNPKARHPFHMHTMIHGQPAFVRETLQRVGQRDAVEFLGRSRHFIVTGCGTSFHAALYGARILQAAFGNAAIVETTNAYDVAYGPPLPPKVAVLGVSHSGSTPTTNRALSRATRAGLRTLGVCGLPDSAMEGIADDVLVIGSTHDRSWANTMSYTTQLVALAGLAAHVAKGWSRIAEGIRSMPRLLQKALGTEDPVRRLARRVARTDRVTFLASGWDEITVLEAALKIRETCGLPASGYHMEQFLHGPFLSLDSRESVVLLRARPDRKRADAIRGAISRSGARISTIGEHPHASIRLPSVHPYLRPIVSIVPMQFLAYYAALSRHANPDIMRTDIPRLRAGVGALFR